MLSALERSELRPGDVGAFVHGTTVVINAITERRGARTALVTTEGFRDVLEIGRGEPPGPVQPRRTASRGRSCPGACGSRCASGSRTPARCSSPLDEAAVESVADRLRALDVEAVAICFLHA